MKKIVVAGGGVLGSQIAFQAAYTGHEVTIWLRSEGSIERAKKKLVSIKESYLKMIEKMADKATKEWANGIAKKGDFKAQICREKVEQAEKKLKFELDLGAAVKKADLVIESVPEVKADKIKFYQMLAPLMDKKTVLATNSSTMLPSTFVNYTGRPDRYLSMHFANMIFKNNITEVMSQSQTSDEAFEAVMKIAESMNMVPLPIRKEKSGYLLNSMLVPLLLNGLDLYVNGISDPESIDKAWTISTGAPKGPFQIMDVVGLNTVYNVVEQYQKVPRPISPLLKKMMMPYNFRGMKKVLKEYIEAGKLGCSTGEGFYKC